MEGAEHPPEQTVDARRLSHTFARTIARATIAANIEVVTVYTGRRSTGPAPAREAIRTTASERGSETRISAATNQSFAISVVPHDVLGSSRLTPKAPRFPIPVITRTPAAAQKTCSYRTAVSMTWSLVRHASHATRNAPPKATAMAATCSQRIASVNACWSAGVIGQCCHRGERH